MSLSYKPFFFITILLLTAIAPVMAQPLSPDHPLLPPELRLMNTSPILTDTWMVTLQAGVNASTLATQLGVENLGSIDSVPNTYLFRVASSDYSTETALSTIEKFSGNSEVVTFNQQVAYQQFSRNPSDDPLNAQPDPFQWHLFPGTHVPSWLNINVESAWNAGFTGTGVQIAIVDDGLQYTHRDLAPNYLAAGSYDFFGNGFTSDPDPAPVTSGDCTTTANCHGTAVAGVAAAADNPPPGGPIQDRDFCGVGVAYGANISGIRLTAGATTDQKESDALKYANGSGGNTGLTNDIYNSSWGPPDDGVTLRGPGPLALAALANGITNGRGGLGSIFVWAGGDGRAYYSQPNFLTYLGDNVNADGYANSRYVIAVAAANFGGQPAYYSEAGAPLLVAAPSGDNANGIATTDLMGSAGYGGTSGYDDCTMSLKGTSAAAPMVSGVVALMLQANPNLTWRDVQHILVNTAVKPTIFDDSWTDNAAGHHVSSRYGFGVVDATAAVNLAQNWTNVTPEISFTSPVIVVNKLIPTKTSGDGFLSSVVIPANIKVEHVEVIFNATHEWRGDIEVNLIAPSGTVSQLMNRRPFDGYLNWPPSTPDTGYSNWKFSTVRHWDEFGGGTWTLNVVDRKPSDSGMFQNWQIIVYGTPTIPRAPIPLSPGMGAEVKANLPVIPVTFNWNTATVFEPDHLELQIDTANPPVDIITIPGSPDTAVINLPVGMYNWRVRSVSTTNQISDWSAMQTLNVTSRINTAPVRNAEAPTTLTWARVSWAVHYEIQIDDVANFTSPLSPTTIVVSQDMLSTTVSLGTGVWYWRIRACESFTSCTGSWSTAEPLVITS